ncbi:hypothetical protein PMAYCL1PPCAC_13543 [Pristionchus mayeri]|uniref:Uncharacterized protein n=1 Tax=Pristionchus mayeri TaxID=1317129 RepID=A0AAN4ZR83_9BILA|nr:hypothetical protein PMAYCL1PPCAC_13543 [Pristionchus mayeri]
MASAETPQSAVEEWMRKALEYSNVSDDGLSEVSSRALEALSLILKGSELCDIRRELSKLWTWSVFFGWTSRTLTNSRFDFRCTTSSNLFTSLLATPLKGNHILGLLRSLDIGRRHCLGFENTEEFSIRSLIYGLIECLNITLVHLTEKKNQGKPSAELSNTEETTTEEIPPSSQEQPSMVIEDKIHISHSKTDIEEGNDNSANDLDRLSMVGNFDTSLKSKMKEEPFEDSKSFLHDNQNSGVDFMGDEIKDETADYDLMEPTDKPIGLSTLGGSKIEPKEEEFKEDDTHDSDEMELKDEFKEEDPLNSDANFDMDFVNDSNEEPMIDENVI